MGARQLQSRSLLVAKDLGTGGIIVYPRSHHIIVSMLSETEVVEPAAEPSLRTGESAPREGVKGDCSKETVGKVGDDVRSPT